MIGLSGVNNFERKIYFANWGYVRNTDFKYSWISALQGEEDSEPQFKDYQSIQKVKALSDLYKRELEVFFAVMII